MLGEALAVAAALMWAASVIAAAKTLKDVDALSANVLKVLFAAISMLPVAFVMGEIRDISNLSFHSISAVVLAAIIGFGIGDTCLLRSMALIGVSKSYTVAYSYPFFTMILSTLFLGEQFHLRYLIGTATIFLGIVNISLERGSIHVGKSPVGLLAAFAAALSWSLGILLIAFGLKTMSAIQANTLRFPLLFISMLPVSKIWTKRHLLARRNLILLGASGILGMSLGGVMFLFSVQLIGVSRAAPMSSSSPVWASLMSSLLLNERISRRTIMSSIMVVAGTYFLT